MLGYLFLIVTTVTTVTPSKKSKMETCKNLHLFLRRERDSFRLCRLSTYWSARTPWGEIPSNKQKSNLLVAFTAEREGFVPALPPEHLLERKNPLG